MEYKGIYFLLIVYFLDLDRGIFLYNSLFFRFMFIFFSIDYYDVNYSNRDMFCVRNKNLDFYICNK